MTLPLVALSLTLLLSAPSTGQVEGRLCHDGSCGAEYVVPEGQLCAGWKFRIEPDWQISDADLTNESVQAALKWLAEHLTTRGYEFELERENRLKLVKGFMLKNDVLNPQIWHAETALNRYCEWLRDEGFWYD